MANKREVRELAGKCKLPLLKGESKAAYLIRLIQKKGDSRVKDHITKFLDSELAENAPFVQDLLAVKSKVESLGIELIDALHAIKNLKDPLAKGNVGFLTSLCAIVAFNQGALADLPMLLTEIVAKEPGNDESNN